MLPAVGAETAARIDTNHRNNTRKHGHSFSLRANIDHPTLWRAYLALCRSNQDPMSRIQRLGPHPVAHSDIRRHLRLKNRCRRLDSLLQEHGLSDAFTVPVVGPHMSLSMIIYAGQRMSLGPATRHLMAQMAADTVTRLHAIIADEPIRPHHFELTNRQLEIASWLIAGKTDWEIGEILSISPKTVNFHVENIKRRYGVKSRSQFIAAIVHQGGLEPV
jgi:DNA-binding CsgD family transcriptional regulator